jgi:DNA-directed RNA polymerase subunit M/transcription elongation factor TFIIS
MKSCKKCGETFTPFSTLDKHCYVCKKTEQALKNLAKIKKDKVKKQKEDLLTTSDYIKMAQQVFNKFIRNRDADKDCISCGAKAGKYTITAGHYFPSTNKSVTFNEDNLHGQCWYNCNSSKSGNLVEYRFGLIERIGLERLEQLEIESRKTKKWTKDELKEIIALYKKKIKDSVY